jgi:uncharacterized protein YsxB (DUF464 family)
MQRPITTLAGTAALAIALWCSTASATILAWASASSYTSNVQYVVPIWLKQDGSKTLTFHTTASAVIRITYNADCVLGGTRGAFVSVKATVDGHAAIGNAGSDLGFCSAVDGVGKTAASAFRQFVYQVPAAGQHTLRIFAELTGDGLYELSNMVTVIED